MDAQRVMDITDELRLLARHEPRWKPLLHRAARALEDQLPPIEKKAARGRYGGRMPPPFARGIGSSVQPQKALQDALI